MLGYMTAEAALAAGFTNHGRYYGIPLWVKSGADFMVAVKWAPMDYVLTAFTAIETLIRIFFWPDDDEVLQFEVGRQIERRKG